MGGVTFGANTSTPNEMVFTDFNSVLVYDIESNAASTVTTFGDVPPHRLGYSAVPGPDGKSIVLFGGYVAKSDQTRITVDPDIYVLDTCNLAWSKKSISGRKPPGLFGHGAANVNNYMVIMLGKTDNDNYSSNVYVLDMNSWEWTTQIEASKLTASETTSSSCQFDLASLSNKGFVPFNYDSSVVQNPFASNDNQSKKKGLGIGLGLFFFLALIGLIVYYYYRRRVSRKTTASNPRWMRTMTSSKNRDGYPMFVYNKDLDNPRFTPTEMTSKQVKTYTASDHEQWEQQLSSANNDKSITSQDIWKRMHNLSNGK